MGKKCVQLVQFFSKTLCINTTYSQLHRVSFINLGTNLVHTQVVTQLFHNLISSTLKGYYRRFYTVPTQPTITTICLYNKKPVII